MNTAEWTVFHPAGSRRVIVTKQLPGMSWIEILTRADCRIEVCTSDRVLSEAEIRTAIGRKCDGVIGQLTETWSEALLTDLQRAGAAIYSNYAVGFNNVNIPSATRLGVPVGNTPGVLTEATAEMAVALTFSAARRVNESERFMRSGRFTGWLPTLFLGRLLWRKTLGIVGAGRIGTAYARMMVEGHKMNLLYYSRSSNAELEKSVTEYGKFLESRGEKAVVCQRATSLESLLGSSDCVSLHTVYDESTHHLIDAKRLGQMKPNAVLVNTSRGPVIDEAALVAHCRRHSEFRAGLDVFENEPAMEDGLSELENVVAVPHIASATRWSREGMAVLAARNVVAMLEGYPVWADSDMTPFLGSTPPEAAPGIVNASDLGLPLAGK